MAMDRQLPSSLAPVVWAEIDFEALAINFRTIRHHVGPGVRVIASIKANGYGHGAVACARRLAEEGVYAFATGDIEEATAIRAAGLRQPILMFGSYLPGAIPALLEGGRTPTVYDLAGAEAASHAAVGVAAVYVKVDCGLGRLGVPVDAALTFIKAIAALPRLRVEGVYTHIPYSDRAGQSWAEGRLTAFEALLAALQRAGIDIPISQALASAGVLAGLRSRANAVCVGHLVYGLSPLEPGEAELVGFSPVLSAIRGRLIHVGRHAAGGDVSIGGHYGLRNAKTTGVVPLGVQQGNRAARPGETAFAVLRGHRIPVMSVSLDHATLDLDEVPDAEVGDVVTFLGKSAEQAIDLAEVARWRGHTPLEVTMTYSDRLPCKAAGT